MRTPHAEIPGVTRPWIWLQLLIGWLPIGALLAVLVLSAHGDATVHQALFVSLRMVVAGALLGTIVYHLTQRVPWPTPIRLTFVAIHVAAALVYAVAFVLVNSMLESLLHGQLVVTVGVGLVPFIVLGMWLYAMIAGVVYANDATARAARAAALAARAQLAALRSQVNPHFLFNALHTVVHLIPRDPARASIAAEEVAGLLRTTLEEDRDLVTLGEELTFVRRYLGLEAIRFSDRLEVREQIADDALNALVPVFSVQTLVENAIRHGAAPRVACTQVTVAASTARGVLTIAVHDTGDGTDSAAVEQSILNGKGTGLRHLRERVAVLYSGAGCVTLESSRGAGFTATLSLPLSRED